MQYDYWFLDPAEYGPMLKRFAITEPEYLAALQEVTNLFPRESSLQYYRAAAAHLGSLGHFDLLPYPNQQLPYNPVPILLNVSGGVLPQLLYLGLALRDFRMVIGQTQAFNNLTSENEEQYRGALFEIEVGAELVRSGLKPTYRRKSPDFDISELPLGVEARIRQVQLSRAIAERLIGTLSSFDFKALFVELTVKGEQDIEELMRGITEDVQRLLSTGENELIQPHYRIKHDLTAPLQRTVALSFEYRYEETLPYLITECLAEKDKAIRKGLAGKEAMMNYVVALDTRSLLRAPFEARSEYERQLVERNRTHFDRERILRQQVVEACQAFTANSPLIKGVLLWGRKSPKCPEEEVHRRYSLCLVTADQSIEVDKQNLRSDLINIAQRKTVIRTRLERLMASDPSFRTVGPYNVH